MINIIENKQLGIITARKKSDFTEKHSIQIQLHSILYSFPI